MYIHIGHVFLSAEGEKGFDYQNDGRILSSLVTRQNGELSSVRLPFGKIKGLEPCM